MFFIVFLAAVTVALPQPVKGDFDRDGAKDSAEIVKAAGGGYKLIIRRGMQGRPATVIAHIRSGNVSNIFIDRAKAGRWKTWCGKGGGAETDLCPRKYVNLRGGELTFGTKEASESVVIWTGTHFEVVLLSD